LAKYVWEQANKSACACSALAGKTEVDQFHAFLAGLLHNVGATILFRAIGREMGGMAPPACEAFHRVVEATLPLLSCRIAHGWDLPNPVVAALNPANTDLPLRRIVTAAVLLAKVHTLVASERYPISALEEPWLDDVEVQKHQDDVFAELDRFAP
jgi:HD-like signal output (HDOD) protein